MCCGELKPNTRVLWPRFHAEFIRRGTRILMKKIKLDTLCLNTGVNVCYHLRRIRTQNVLLFSFIKSFKYARLTYRNLIITFHITVQFPFWYNWQCTYTHTRTKRLKNYVSNSRGLITQHIKQYYFYSTQRVGFLTNQVLII